MHLDVHADVSVECDEDDWEAHAMTLLEEQFGEWMDNCVQGDSLVGVTKLTSLSINVSEPKPVHSGCTFLTATPAQEVQLSLCM